MTTCVLNMQLSLPLTGKMPANLDVGNHNVYSEYARLFQTVSLSHMKNMVSSFCFLSRVFPFCGTLHAKLHSRIKVIIVNNNTPRDYAESVKIPFSIEAIILHPYYPLTYVVLLYFMVLFCSDFC